MPISIEKKTRGVKGDCACGRASSSDVASATPGTKQLEEGANPVFEHEAIGWTIGEYHVCGWSLPFMGVSWEPLRKKSGHESSKIITNCWGKWVQLGPHASNCLSGTPRSTCWWLRSVGWRACGRTVGVWDRTLGNFNLENDQAGRSEILGA